MRLATQPTLSFVSNPLDTGEAPKSGVNRGSPPRSGPGRRTGLALTSVTARRRAFDARRARCPRGQRSRRV